MKVESITSAVSSLALAFGEGSSSEKTMSRPFGVALLFAGVDKNGPRYDSQTRSSVV
jgi:20S proteasome subunit alpha 5